MSIPKIIHYCWFGKKAKGKLVAECLESWKLLLKDYQLIEWNETNYSSNSYFFNTCMAQKKYAFASDYARFDILEKNGGIYLDTDMLVMKSFDELLSGNCFFGYEHEELNISCGIIGATAHDPFITAIRKELDIADSEGFFMNYTIVKLVNSIYNKLKITNQALLPKAYPVDYFYPYPFGAGGDPLSYKTTNTIAIHLWSASWFNDFNKAELLYTQGKKAAARKLYFKSLIRKPQYIRFLTRFFL